MPIKFYCDQCGQKLSISSKKAGKTVACPACRARITIPAESETKRPKKPQKPIAPPTEMELPARDASPIDQDQNQLLDDLDNLGPLGESWDELLEEDWEQVAAEEDRKSSLPASSQKHSSPVSEVEDEAPAEIENEDSSASAEPEKESRAAESDSNPPVVETKIETPAPETSATSASPASVSSSNWEEEEEDDDDDDDGFSIRSVDSDFEEMDLTPMVDVTFLLLIFFMITASFSLQKSIEVPPPNPDEDGVSQSLQTLDDFREESIIVEIDNNNGIYVDDVKLTNPAEIVQAILDRRDEGGRPKQELVLSAHKAARHETVVAVVDAANEVGMQKIRLANYRGPED